MLMIRFVKSQKFIVSGHMWQLFLDFLFPRRSLRGAEGAWITAAEQSHLASHPVIEETTDLRKRGIVSLDRLVAASTYAHCPLLKKAIHTFKYGGVRSLDHSLGHLIVQATPPKMPSDAVLCPVPLHWTRRFSRGFNQAEYLARIVGREKVGMRMERLLRRIRPTGSQAMRKRAERLTAVKDAFRWIGNIPPSCVILIDDLSTTGATLDACATALKKSGVERVEGWVIAHDERRT